MPKLYQDISISYAKTMPKLANSFSSFSSFGRFQQFRQFQRFGVSAVSALIKEFRLSAPGQMSFGRQPYFGYVPLGVSRLVSVKPSAFVAFSMICS